jgi:hypothetical protein
MICPSIFRRSNIPRSRWLLDLLYAFPTTASITGLSMEESVESAWPITGRKVVKQRLLEDGRTAQSSIGLPVGEDSEAVAMFRVVLSEMKHLWQLR